MSSARDSSLISRGVPSAMIGLVCELVVRVGVSELEVVQLEPGQPVTVALDAL